MDTRTEAGDVFALSDNEVLVYGREGIALKLNKRNLETLQRVYDTLDCVKDYDIRDRRYTVAYNVDRQDFRFEPVKGDQVRVAAWQFGFEPKRKAA